FDHLWLLDASWERATEGQVIEQNLKRDFPEHFADELTIKEKAGRVDIKYRTAAGAHIIVELKRYKREVTVAELEEQGIKYKSALYKLLTQQGETNPQIRVVFVLGKAPSDLQNAALPKDYATRKLGILDASISYYDSLITNAIAAYQDYFDASAKRDKIDAVLKQLA
ncbi:MAG: ATP-binding protein, partial [Betaproteobacteria bacterium]|nr:ATP-binding protein [Betaproteobacteria bacterium]